ncbi:hypothetical protein SAMN04487819_1283 [Actinopolyspora alba]|uniref:Uncharacterized protein n=1 Tax=Actinopolyspora alba TaxID=673379 RepID=A0A1I2CN30_9ACTN|nr:hypothetical protein [Actinopolyspora alba]SFE69532.1 hypothetical protein SAMN04487819_1283 [Actinopolyspora alba]
MDRVEDVSPHELRHAAVPNTTVDELTSINLLSLAVLTNFLRHAAEYGQTLTKLVRDAGSQGPRKSQISTAYNTLIERGYVGRVEFSYQRPAGSSTRSGQRATYQWTSRVPISHERIEEIIHRHTPGRYTLTPIDTGALDPTTGRPVYELRRVKVLSAEIYYYDGPRRIHADGLLSERIPGRGGKPKQKAQKAQKAQPSSDPSRKGNTGQDAEDSEESEEPSPESQNSTSGASTDDEGSSHLTPEVDSPEAGESTSIKNGPPDRDHPPENKELPPSLALGWPPDETPPPSEFRPDEDDQRCSGTDETNQAGLAGERSPAHARNHTEEPAVKAALAEDPNLSREDVETIIMRANPALNEGQAITRAAQLIKEYA